MLSCSKTNWFPHSPPLPPLPPRFSKTLTRVYPHLPLLCNLGTPTVMDTLLRGSEWEPSPAAPATVLTMNPNQPFRWLPTTLLRLRSSSLVVRLSRVSREQGEAAPVPSAGHMLPAVQLPVALWEWVSRWNMTSGFQPGMHHVPTTSLYTLPCFVAVHCNLSMSWHLGTGLGGFPQRMSTMPLSILGLLSLDEKSKSAVT